MTEPPLPNDLLAPGIDLLDRYTRRSGSILMNGVQALVRLMLLQAERDRLAGLNTGGFVSGYRGSPLGTLDQAFGTAAALVDRAGIIVQPAVNEELAATAIAGSQKIDGRAPAAVEGVFALWYGKGPGLDRASDAIRHGNYQGAAPKGGVVLAVGDDHLAKSSSIVCYSDEMVAGLQVPLFYPADSSEIVTFGLHAFALSRLSGSWAALKIINEVADATRSSLATELAGIASSGEGKPLPSDVHGRWPEMPLEQEARLLERRLPAVADYVHANDLDRIALKERGARIGLVAAGKSWLDLREALALLGLRDKDLAALGIALYKPALIWPLESRRLAQFAAGLETIVVVEEKGEFIERQIKGALYHAAAHPAVLGKRGADGDALLPATGDLSPEVIALALGRALAASGVDPLPSPAIARLLEGRTDQLDLALAPNVRKPFFCSGCPHNISTAVPAGSRALAGIGCHGLAAYNNSQTSTFAQMGGEGIHWMGMAPFTDEPHVFANMGDGTYFHSGLLAIRQAVAAGLTMTYKLLYNSAVAMTGGQTVDGQLDVPGLVSQLRAEGVAGIAILTDDAQRYARDPVREQVLVIDTRDRLDAVQERFRATSGVTVIVYDEMCATEKRRLRKRGLHAAAPTSVFINEAVCEACGDCSVKSNCLSVEPIETDLGPKRRINQSSCNKDTSCLAGFCPSFVTVQASATPSARPSLPVPPTGMRAPSAITQGSDRERILIAGIGGTGVVTVSALLAMSGHLAGRSVAVLDQIGMAQKGGAVTSHVHLADQPPGALRIGPRQADLVLVCDPVVGNARDVMAAVEAGRTRLVINTDVAITGDFTQDRNAIPDSDMLLHRIVKRAGEGAVEAFPFSRLAEMLLADAIAANLMMLGLAYQKGWVTLDLGMLEQAIRLNKVKVEANLAAFAWGRQLAIEPGAILVAAGIVPSSSQETVDELLAGFEHRLSQYQDDAYAARFRRAIDRVRKAEAAHSEGDAFTRAAATSLYRLMAYKDEYEVARLFTDGTFLGALESQFGSFSGLSFHMAPPLIAKRDKHTGELQKRRFGAWLLPVLRLLARGRRLRGTALDPFGYQHERQAERALINEFEIILGQLANGLNAKRIADATRIAALPGEIRGFGHIKRRAIANYRTRLDELLGAFGRAEDSLLPQSTPRQVAR